MIIALEGLDGAGKTVQTDKMVDHMREMGIGITRFDFPDYDTPTGVAIRKCLDTLDVSDAAYPRLHRLMAENRLARLPDIQDALDRGDTLVMNRYCDSNLVYGIANGLDREWLIGLDAQMPAADITILLDISVDDSFQRKHVRDGLEARKNFMTKVSEMYRQVASEQGWACVNGRLNPHLVHEKILGFVVPLCDVAKIP